MPSTGYCTRRRHSKFGPDPALSDKSSPSLRQAQKKMSVTNQAIQSRDHQHGLPGTALCQRYSEPRPVTPPPPLDFGKLLDEFATDGQDMSRHCHPLSLEAVFLVITVLGITGL